jgi:hypothetical protein
VFPPDEPVFPWHAVCVIASITSNTSATMSFPFFMVSSPPLFCHSRLLLTPISLPYVLSVKALQASSSIVAAFCHLA